MSRAIILVADGLGIGAAPDAADFNDVGANTFGHICHYIKENQNRTLALPNLQSLGLYQACEAASASALPQLDNVEMRGASGFMAEISSGKDTPSGHWEMAGVPVLFEWGYFEKKTESFPPEIIDEICRRANVDGILAIRHAPGTDVLEWHGEEHIKTGKPICYTSVDSVFQVAAHESHFGLERLYEFCEIARDVLDDHNIGRVIARPFVGENSSEFKRTGNRRDYSVLPPAKTVLDKMFDAGGEVISIGKISDIYAHQGISQKFKATGLEALIDTTLEQMQTAPDKSIIFTNLVNFDQDFGHRRDVLGYANALEYFDKRLADVFSAMREDDVLYITADHGCDPTWPGTDHTREYVPLLMFGQKVAPLDLGQRSSFADLGQTIAAQFNLSEMDYGESVWQNVVKN